MLYKIDGTETTAGEQFTLAPDLCALTKKINDNALSLIFQMANE